MINLKKELEQVQSAVILGHVRPDGDCVGSCLALYNYIVTYYPKIQVKVYLEPFPEEFHLLKYADRICFDPEEDICYDLCFSLDSADWQRHGAYYRYFQTAKRTIGIDHHISNQGFAKEHLIRPEASATAEVLYDLIGKENLTKEIAECLFLGIAHDTGVFQYSNTSPKTMRAVADLLEMGILGNQIIDETFYQKSYDQIRILGKTLEESRLYSQGKVILGVVTQKDMEEYAVTSKDLDGIVSQLRYTRGVEMAVFLYELQPDHFKVSLRSNSRIDVNAIAGKFGGGGHVKAAGCEISGTPAEIIKQICPLAEQQLWGEAE